jgi:hypothetical protein
MFERGRRRLDIGHAKGLPTTDRPMRRPALASGHTGRRMRYRRCTSTAAMAVFLSGWAVAGQESEVQRPTGGSAPPPISAVARPAASPTPEPLAELPRGGRRIFPKHRLVGLCGGRGVVRPARSRGHRQARRRDREGRCTIRCGRADAATHVRADRGRRQSITDRVRPLSHARARRRCRCVSRGQEPIA